ncbi:hypothetical protein BC826DRAFT_715439 [Russula brevipes]|nr:hypothetical protein BC826DRAFT_715439 [Russula brevipes]
MGRWTVECRRPSMLGMGMNMNMNTNMGGGGGGMGGFPGAAGQFAMPGAGGMGWPGGPMPGFPGNPQRSMYAGNLYAASEIGGGGGGGNRAGQGGWATSSVYGESFGAPRDRSSRAFRQSQMMQGPRQAVATAAAGPHLRSSGTVGGHGRGLHRRVRAACHARRILARRGGLLRAAMDWLGPCLRLRAGRVLHDNRFVNQALLLSMTVRAVCFSSILFAAAVFGP